MWTLSGCGPQNGHILAADPVVALSGTGPRVVTRIAVSIPQATSIVIVRSQADSPEGKAEARLRSGSGTGTKSKATHRNRSQ